MRRISLFAAAALMFLVFAPGLVEAKAGGGASMGSRGSRTYAAPAPTNTAPSYAAPVERSATPFAAPSPGYAPGSSGYASGPGRRGAFTSGLMGGLVGAGIGGLLFGHGLFGGFDGIGSLFGLIIQLGLLFLVGRWLVRMVMRRQPALAGMAGGIGALRQAVPPLAGRPTVGSTAPGVAITREDYASFERVLQEVQASWSAQDLARLGRVATPEMVGYFNEQLSELSSRGVHNTVRDVRLQKGDLSEAWAERGREYATVAMRFTMIDATVDGAGRVVDGSATEHQTATELWTFLRTTGGGWVLSAIQQGR